MEKLKNLTSELNIQENVLFLGKIPHTVLRPLYECSDVFLFPSLFEGLGRAILEAMSFGLPIITSNYGPVTELVIHKKNGFLIPPNDPIEISQALQNLLEDENLRQEFGKQSNNFVKNYDFSRINKIEIDFIKKIIKKD